jgi:CRP/FNR family transcriptional regulator/CRP/FNR family cyclic AMP-dependent transcriptional regulator
MHLKAEDRAFILQFIRNVPFFRNVSDNHLEQIIDDFKIAHAQKDEVIVYQTDKSTDMYIIIKGRVKVTLLSEEGEEFILTDLQKGDFFGELSLIDGSPRSATVIAEEDSTFGILKRENLLAEIQREPMIAVDLLTSVVHRFRYATEREEQFAFLDVRERIFKLFEQCIANEGNQKENGFYLIRKRTHKDIALRIGSSRESVTKILKTLVAKKLIIEKKDCYLISPSVCKKKEDIS